MMIVPLTGDGSARFRHIRKLGSRGAIGRLTTGRVVSAATCMGATTHDDEWWSIADSNR